MWGRWEWREYPEGGRKWRLRFDVNREDSLDAYPDTEEMHHTRCSQRFVRRFRIHLDDSEHHWWRADRFVEKIRNQAMKHFWEKYEVLADGSHAVKAASLVRRYGFVLIRNVLTSEQIDALWSACRELEGKFLENVWECEGSRGPGRHTFSRIQLLPGERACCSRPEWVAICDIPAVVSVLKELLGPDVLCISMGGDFVVTGTAQYQSLHSDLGTWPQAQDETIFGNRPPLISVKFTVSHIGAEDCPMRIWPGTISVRRAR